MKAWAVSIVCLVLAGCAGAPPVVQPAALLQDELFAPAPQRIDARDVFALSDEMKQFIEQRMTGAVRSRSLQQGLIEALYTRSQLQLQYDAAMTRNAAQAFEARSGNCLSLVIMTAAFAKELGLQVQYQSVFLPEAWSRSGDLYFSSGHVNLSLGKRIGDVRDPYDVNSLLTIDFIPAEQLRGLRTRTLDERTIVAMYMNNKAAESLVRGQLDEAYWWAREAIRQAPGYPSSYNTLGVIYLRHQNLAQAERALGHALQREPENVQVMSNLVTVLQRQGRTAEAQQLAQRLAQVEPVPPFHYFELGQAALRKGDYKLARDMFAREVSRAGDYHEFHFWLAVAHAGLGNLRQARAEMNQAIAASTSVQERDLYASKLARIKSYRVE